MRKVLLFITFILAFSNIAFAARTSKKSSQEIIGFVGTDTHFDVVEYELLTAMDGDKKGINLDYTDSTNAARYLIAPTTNMLTQAGLQIGDLSLIASSINNEITTVTLRIKHSHLEKVGDPSVKVDYELALRYAVSHGDSSGLVETPARFCLSEDSTNQYADASQKVITISFLLEENEIVAIHNAGIYFRLTKDSPVTVEGQYYSIATFELEVE